MTTGLESLEAHPYHQQGENSRHHTPGHRASSAKVVLKTASESSKFLPGDYVAIYKTTDGDVIPGTVLTGGE